MKISLIYVECTYIEDGNKLFRTWQSVIKYSILHNEGARKDQCVIKFYKSVCEKNVFHLKINH